jgi:hypothetical protein
MIDAIGWVATALFVTSYFAASRRSLLVLQFVAALLWLGYGVLLRAPPVIVANLLVAGAAAYNGFREPSRSAAATRAGAGP